MEEPRKCRDCGVEVIGRAWYCTACREERAKISREKYAVGKKVTTVCGRCGREFETMKRRGNPLATYCPDCHHVVAGETRRARRAEPREKLRQRIIKKLPGVAPINRPMLPEPGGSKDGLEHVVWEIEVINRYRMNKGEKLLSYGSYVPARKKLAGEYKRAIAWAVKTQKFYKER